MIEKNLTHLSHFFTHISHYRQAVPRRPRGEKKPIPEELKDGKYFERRKRNNLAAKKSRDQRKVIIIIIITIITIIIIMIIIVLVKVRESQICQRATLLEKENAVLRAQVTSILLSISISIYDDIYIYLYYLLYPILSNII